jgi:hypothetical protein
MPTLPMFQMEWSRTWSCPTPSIQTDHEVGRSASCALSLTVCLPRATVSAIAAPGKTTSGQVYQKQSVKRVVARSRQ